MAKHSVPKRENLMWPIMRALKARGGSASIEELYEQITSDMKLPDEILDAPHPRSPRSEFEYRLAWARTDLKIYAGAIDNPTRGIWVITALGRKIKTENELLELVHKNRSQQLKIDRKNKAASTQESDENSEELEWKESLLEIIQSIKPSSFERLCQLILRTSGFVKVNITGRSGDGGIDGTGVLRINLLSFHVQFQCKRYAGLVTARDMRDFRGAIVGRGDKGLFITTGRFTKGAQQEAARDGAPPIDLIDGEALCDLLKELGMGIKVKTKTVEIIIPEEEYFASI